MIKVYPIRTKMSNKTKTILIRADSSATIGTGHIMRDLVLAKRYFPNDEVIFATQELEGNINNKILQEGYAIEPLCSNDLEEFEKIIQQHNPNMIIIDHYGVDYEIEKELKNNHPSTTLLVLDDTYEKHHCDILLNHNIYADEKRYENLVPKGCEVWCGERYTLIRDEFKEVKANIENYKYKNGKFNVFVAMGGADHSNITSKIVDSLRDFGNMHLHIVTTSANKNLSSLQNYLKSQKNTTLYVDANNIAAIMGGCDLCIVTPSVILNEVFFLQLPFIAIETASNQKEMSRYLEKQEYYIMYCFDKDILRKMVQHLYKGIS